MQATKLLLLLSLTFFSCASNERAENKTNTIEAVTDEVLNADTVKKQMPLPTPANGDTLTIDRKAAVFYQPDSLQIERRMKEIGEADFRTGMDDYIYYVNTSAEYLEKQGLPVLDAKDKKWLKFILADKKVQLIKLDTLEELWGMYLFDSKRKAYRVDMTLIEDEYKNYYK